MSSILLTDPVLQWLQPKELQALRVLNRQHRDVIDQHALTETNYTVKMNSGLSWRSREALYARHPNIKALTFEMGGPDYLEEYLRPTLESLHLQVPLLLARDPEYPETFQWENADIIGQELKHVETFLQKNPGAQLHTLSISFGNTTRLTFLNDRSMVVNYDRYGPVYEDYDRVIEDPYGSAGIYFAVIEQGYQTEALADNLKSLCSMRAWKSISLPAEFPGATEVPKAILSEPCDKDDDAIESLWEHISYLRCRR